MNEESPDTIGVLQFPLSQYQPIVKPRMMLQQKKPNPNLRLDIARRAYFILMNPFMVSDEEIERGDRITFEL